jgi:hypothetical protein
MPNKNVVIGFALGLGIGAAVGLLYAPESGEEARQLLREKAADAIRRFMFNLRWIVMSPRDRYAYLWHHSGSLREWRKGYAMSKPG